MHVYLQDLNLAPVEGARVSIVFTLPNGDQYPIGDSQDVISNSEGYVWFELHGLRDEHDPVVFDVVDITHAELNYQPTLNSDADGDSDGTTIIVSQSGVIPPSIVASSIWTSGQDGHKSRGENDHEDPIRPVAPSDPDTRRPVTGLPAAKSSASAFADVNIDDVLAQEDQWLPIVENLPGDLIQ